MNSFISMVMDTFKKKKRNIIQYNDPIEDKYNIDIYKGNVTLILNSNWPFGVTLKYIHPFGSV